MSKSRLEAFSDGVFAVAITLLVLDLKVPAPGGRHSLGHDLAHMWPNYLALAISFITIGIIWINHHAMIGRLREPDHMILTLNLLLLLSVVVLPFATSLFAEYLREGEGQKLASAVYSGAFTVMAILFFALNRHILVVKPQLMAREIPYARRRQILTRSFTGLIPYVLATVLAAVSPYITLGITSALALFYAVPIASGSERSEA